MRGSIHYTTTTKRDTTCSTNLLIGIQKRRRFFRVTSCKTLLRTLHASAVPPRTIYSSYLFEVLVFSVSRKFGSMLELCGRWREHGYFTFTYVTWEGFANVERTWLCLKIPVKDWGVKNRKSLTVSEWKGVNFAAQSQCKCCSIQKFTLILEMCAVRRDGVLK